MSVGVLVKDKDVKLTRASDRIVRTVPLMLTIIIIIIIKLKCEFYLYNTSSSDSTRSMTFRPECNPISQQSSMNLFSMSDNAFVQVT